MRSNQPESEQKPDFTKKVGNWMWVVTWLIALGLLGLYFDDFLGRQYNPNQTVEMRYGDGQVPEVVLKRNRYGHYVASGDINGKSATFLLDTGATTISIPKHLAEFYGLPSGASYSVSTANGRVRVNATTISSLVIGNIRLIDVHGHLNPGLTGDEILLGMSALKQLEFTQRGDQLILRPQ